ncbi:MAG: glycosyltransferase [bacterium]|nr:glycosyltransferase [bacterium]
MADNVPISVLMTVRNGEPYVEEAVRSVLDQAYRDFVFLILDNASTDRSREIVRGFQDSRVRLVELERDYGQTGALNRGLELADTPYIARMDADDVSHPQRLEQQMAFLNKHPDVALVGSWCEVIDLDGQVFSQFRLPVDHFEILEGMLFENQFIHSAVVYNREAVLACGGYDAGFKHAQDYALWWRIGLKHKVANVPEFLVRLRMHPGQATRAFRAEAAEEPFQIVLNALGDPGLPVEVRGAVRRATAYADLKYAAAISGFERWSRPVARMARGLFRDPLLVMDRSARSYVARVLLGQRGFQAVRNLRRGADAAGEERAARSGSPKCG